MLGFYISHRMEHVLRWLKWPGIALGLALVIGFYVGVFILLRKLVRRWRTLARSRRGALRVAFEVVGTLVFATAWVLASRGVP